MIVTRHNPSQVPPFGHPQINARSPTPQGLSQAATSFISSWYQGIHRMPTKTKHNTNMKTCKNRQPAGHSTGRQASPAACDTGDAGTVCQYSIQRGRSHVCRPHRGRGRCGAGRCRRVRACGDHDNRHRCAHRLRRRTADEHPHGAARHGRRPSDHHEQLLPFAGAERAGDRATAHFQAADLVHLRLQRATVGLRAGVLYDLCFRHGVRITELRTQSNYNESGIFGYRNAVGYARSGRKYRT